MAIIDPKLAENLGIIPPLGGSECADDRRSLPPATSSAPVAVRTAEIA